MRIVLTKEGYIMTNLEQHASQLTFDFGEIVPPGCDKCIWDLTDDLRLAALSIEESKSSLLSVSSGAAAHRHVNEINSTIYLLKVCKNGVLSVYFHSGFTGSLQVPPTLLLSESSNYITDC